MVHSLIPMSVDIKTRIFEKPARLVNAMELTCAIGMAFAQAGFPMPELKVGGEIREFWEKYVPQIRDNPKVNESLKHVILNYIFKKSEVIEEDSVITLQLGYEFR